MTDFMQKMMKCKLHTVTTDKYEISFNMPKSYPPIKARKAEEGGVRDRFFAAKAELPDEITVIHPFLPDGFFFPADRVFFVSPNGSDTAAGTEASPLKTIGEALSRAENKGGAKIILESGSYELSAPLIISSKHSGTERTPLIITAKTDCMPKISASTRLLPADFKHIITPKMSNLSAEARKNVLVYDLKPLGIKNYGEIRIGGTDLLINDTKQPLARYPNEDERLLDLGNNIIDAGRHKDEDGNEVPWAFGFEDSHCYNWEFNDEIFIYGALTYEWIHDFTRVGEIDSKNKIIRGANNYLYPCGIQARAGNDFCFVNVFEELDAPGEWYLDRKEELLYLYPPRNVDFEAADIRLITSQCNIFVAEGVKNVIFDRLNVGRCAGAAFLIKDCEQALIQRCNITGVGAYDSDDSAVIIKGGKRSGIIASEIQHFICRALTVGGGDRLHLVPANNFVQNNMVINPHCRFGICANTGVGNIISHNYINNTTTLSAGENECIHEYNVMEGGDCETSDSGMVYVGGCGLSSGGNHYRYNYYFDFAKIDYGVYFDDLARGMYAYGNIVVGNGTTGYLQWNGGGRSYNIHNGAEHCLYNNISIDAGYFAFGGDVTYWLFDANWNSLYNGLKNSVKSMNSPEFLARYPGYAALSPIFDKYDEDRSKPDYVTKSGEAEIRLRTPCYNNYENNVIVRAARAFKLDNGEATATSLETNYITDSDPGFYDFASRDYRIKPDAPLFEKIPDFVPPPFEKMGLVND